MRYGFIIVFNAIHTIRACARNALKSVDKLVIVEGVVKNIAHLSNNGHSTDGTLRVIEELCMEYGDRVIPVIGEAEFWLSKLDMCNEAVRRMEPGSWVVEFDSDEFYFPDRLNEMMSFLEKSDYTCAEVWARQYYGSLRTHTPCTAYTWGNILPWRRMFRYDGLPWDSHTPPRLGSKTEEKVFPRELAQEIFAVQMHHAAYIWREQVSLRASYFGQPSILRHWERHKSTGANGPHVIRYDGPQPWTESDFE